MSDQIKHECGIAFIRLKKNLDFYLDKYGTALYGLNKLYLLMEKQHNRGQDGAGLATIKLDMPPGSRYISRKRSVNNQPILDIFEYIFNKFQEVEEKNPEKLKDVKWLKQQSFTGEVLLGHLRYGTHGKNQIENCHPFLRQNNWMTRNLVLAGNFNMTNVDELFGQLVEIGQHPKEQSDTVTVLEKIGHFLDVENQRLFDKFKTENYSNKKITELISTHLSVENIIKRSLSDFDGGYLMAGLIGHGDAFVVRDPAGIRPGYFYEDDEVVVAASERPAIQTAFKVHHSKIEEIPPAHVLIVKKDGRTSLVKACEPTEKKPCSFERIYFSRGSDKEIYKERKMLGELLTDQILKAVDYDFDNTIFSFVPNTAETAFYGMLKGVETELNKRKYDKVKSAATKEELIYILNQRPRVEKLIIKDAKLRTFISQDSGRDELVSHVYDVTYGIVNENVDKLVVIDDSIVRGTTLQKSIIKNLDRLNPKEIIIVSSAPQIRYPDCYGIDMSKMNDFIAFRAALELLKESNKESILDDILKACKRDANIKNTYVENHVKALYKPFTVDEINAKIAEMVRTPEIKAEIKIIYQTIEHLHEACPGHKGDWYFTGNYPTSGGNKVANRAYINFMEGIDERAY
ncbi:MAG: amidophosphoribosyltransferase [Chitinophagaceae bacterium]|nr:MAG: amidophosphoribosyltransferase [Chitinophagaceae bacterium]